MANIAEMSTSALLAEISMGRQMQSGGPGSGPRPGEYTGDPNLMRKFVAAYKAEQYHKGRAKDTEKDEGLSSTYHKKAAAAFGDAKEHYENGNIASGDAKVVEGSKHAKKAFAMMDSKSVKAATHEHHAGEFANRDATIAKLTKHGFSPDPGNATVNAPDHKAKHFHKIMYDPDTHKPTSTHSVMVKPDGSFEHLANLSNHGHGAKDVDYLAKTFQAASNTRKTVGKTQEDLDVFLLRLSAREKGTK